MTITQDTAPSEDAVINTVTPSKDDLEALLALQRSAFRADGPPSAAVRRNRIDRLIVALLERADELGAAMDADFGQRPRALSSSVDTLGLLGDSEDIRAHLEEWMEPVPLNESGSAFVQQHPLGVVGVIGAWNFPVTLVIQPAIAAIAAGNRVLIKMPSMTPRTGAVLAAAISEHFAQSEIAVVLGGGRVNDDFCSLEFDHLIFTGSPAVGAVVQQTAAKNLVPVTLELGGKNPMVVDEAADLDLAADRIAVSRMANGGQICLCGDYVLVANSVKEELVTRLTERLFGYFPTYADNPTTVSIINDSNFRRIVGLVDDAVSRGARKIEIVSDAERDLLPDPVKRLVAPTLLVDVPAGADINTEEVFGPVLAIYGYDTPQDAIDHVNAGPAPLAAYWYGPDGDHFAQFCALTTSGGVSRNDGFLHSSFHGAPFGGVGRSGHGAYHGKAGFDTFTHRRPIASADADAPMSVMGALVGPALASPELAGGLEQAVAGALQFNRSRIDEFEQARTAPSPS